ncbi:hypothetical protein FRC00_009671 [Tulasnella sp. 408]|nr:hypothetical protein FRC00_009671 [Tulasnella sp. 408]
MARRALGRRNGVKEEGLTRAEENLPQNLILPTLPVVTRGGMPALYAIHVIEVNMIENMQYEEYGEVGALSPFGMPVVQEGAVRSTSTALALRVATSERRKRSGVGSGRSTSTEGIDDRSGDADDVDGVKNVDAHSGLSSAAYRTGATMSWKFIDTPATRNWNDGV